MLDVFQLQGGSSGGLVLTFEYLSMDLNAFIHKKNRNRVLDTEIVLGITE